jgi:hypothetical protein
MSPADRVGRDDTVALAVAIRCQEELSAVALARSAGREAPAGLAALRLDVSRSVELKVGIVLESIAYQGSSAVGP